MNTAVQWVNADNQLPHSVAQPRPMVPVDELQTLMKLLEPQRVHAHDDINVVPLIDVLLVLLVALLVAMPVMVQNLAVRIPQTEATPAKPAAQSVLRVVIDASGNVQWPDGKDFSDPQRTLKVQADAAVPYDAVAKVLAEASAAGMTSIDLMTRR